MNGVTPANTFVSGPLSADSSGNIYYNVIQLNVTGGNPWNSNDVANAWLVKITPSDSATKVTYATLVPNAPPGNSMSCPGTFASLPNAVNDASLAAEFRFDGAVLSGRVRIAAAGNQYCSGDWG